MKDISDGRKNMQWAGKERAGYSKSAVMQWAVVCGRASRIL